MKNSSGKYDFEWLEPEEPKQEPKQEPSTEPKPGTAPKRNLKLGLVKDSKTWGSKADDALCFICKDSSDNLYHFLFIVLISVTILIHFGQIWSLKLQTAILQMAAMFLVFLQI